jgi:hypothetical protein
MIRSLRRRHRASAFLLALLLPAAYVAALSARTEPAPVPPERADSALDVSLGVDAFGRLVLELDASGAPVIPDAHVYWAPDASEERELPDGAVLLGALHQDASQLFSLPYAARERRGVALVFSLAWHKRVAAFALDDAAARRGARP